MLIGPQTIKQFLAVTSIVVVTGCQSLGNFEDWSNVPEPKKPQVSQVQYSHQVSFDPASANLSGKEGDRLLGFLNNAKAARKDAFYLVSANAEVPVSLSDARKTNVADYLSTFGVEIRKLSGDFGVKIPQDHSVNLIIRRYVVTLPGCPDWSGERFTYNNVPTSNWGCANATNLGLMVAEPGDLLRGRDEGYGDGEYAATSISNYRKGETRSLNPEDVGITQAQQKSGGQ
jgi:pilus assembly protein CpaD